MPLQSSEIARRQEDRLELRPDPLRLRWTLDDLVSSDGHTFHLTFTMSVRALPQKAEQRMLEEVFLSTRPSVTADDIVRHFQPAIRAAAAAASQSRTAADLLDDSARKPMVEALRADAARLAFSSGLELLPPFDLQLSSPSLERQRIEAMQQELAERKAAGQLQHFQRAAELLRHFESIRQSAPQLSPSDVLRQLNPADQGAMLQTLLLAAGRDRPTETAWAVAGDCLLQVDPHRSPPTGKSIALPTTLGPLRSVQPDSTPPTLLIGARSGLWVVDPAAPETAASYLDLQVTSALGFSRALRHANRLWACHGEAGVVSWDLDQPSAPAFAIRPDLLSGAGPRNLQAIDEHRLIFSAGTRLFILEPSDSARPVEIPSALTTECVAVLPDERSIVLVSADGTVQLRDRQTLQVQRLEKRATSATAAALLPWLGSSRLLLAPEDGPLLGIGLEDDLVTQYLSPYRGYKALTAAPDLIAGLSGDRQRIVFWQTWNPRQPLGELFVPACTRHRAADVDLSPAAPRA